MKNEITVVLLSQNYQDSVISICIFSAIPDPDNLKKWIYGENFGAVENSDGNW